MARRVLDSAAQLSRDVRRSTKGLTPLPAVQDVYVTHYGESYNGESLGCSDETYASDNGSIIAVGPERDAEWPCGTVLRICGPGGCLVGVRQDGCPGCDAYLLDLSEEGLYLVCGPGSGVCSASVEPLTQSSAQAESPACDAVSGYFISDVAGAREGRGMRLFTSMAQAALADRTAYLLRLNDGPGQLAPVVCTVQGKP